MLLPLNSFAALVEQMAASVQGGAQQLIDLSVGSVLRAVLEASAGVGLWMQWLILQVLSMTRAATSVGADLDSWMADFSLARLPGSQAAGAVTFSRYTAGLATAVPVGTIVRTTDASQSFAVVADAGNPAWDGSANYLLGAAVASVTVPVQAVQAGSAGNVLPGAIGLLGAPLPAIDTVGNGAALAGGTDPESDAALRLRFQAYVNSRSLATAGAVGAAIAGLRQGLRTAIAENVDASGNTMPGHFCVTVDDGSGYPPSSLLAAVQGAVDAVRPLGSTFSVQPPAVILATVSMSLQTSNALTRAAVAAAVQQAVLGWIAGLPIGGTLALSKIEALAHGCDASVLSVTGTQIDGVASDLVAPPGGVIVASTVVVN